MRLRALWSVCAFGLALALLPLGLTAAWLLWGLTGFSAALGLGLCCSVLGLLGFVLRLRVAGSLGLLGVSLKQRR